MTLVQIKGRTRPSSPATGPYGTLKAAWHLDRIEAMRRGEQAAPVSMQLILSDHCNHDCSWCAYRSSSGFSSELFGGVDKSGAPTHNPVRMIQADKAVEIIDDARAIGVKSVTFTGGGEPTVHPEHLSLFEYALESGLECSLNTNGHIMRRGWQAVLPRFTYIRFSIDGGSAEEYARVRRVKPDVYGKVLNNLSALSAEVRSSSSRCVVGAGYVISPGGGAALVDGVKRIRDAGAAYVRLASVQSVDGFGATYTDDDAAEIREAIYQARGLATSEFQVISLFDEVQGRAMSDRFCGFQQMVLYVGGDLGVYRCCYTAYTSLGKIGSLAHQRLATWFASEEKASAVGGFDATSCASCPLAEKNEAIAYMVNRPMHVNFI